MQSRPWLRLLLPGFKTKMGSFPVQFIFETVSFWHLTPIVSFLVRAFPFTVPFAILLLFPFPSEFLSPKPLRT